MKELHCRQRVAKELKASLAIDVVIISDLKAFQTFSGFAFRASYLEQLSKSASSRQGF